MIRQHLDPEFSLVLYARKGAWGAHTSAISLMEFLKKLPRTGDCYFFDEV